MHSIQLYSVPFFWSFIRILVHLHLLLDSFLPSTSLHPFTSFCKFISTDIIFFQITNPILFFPLPKNPSFKNFIACRITIQVLSKHFRTLRESGRSSFLTSPNHNGLHWSHARLTQKPWRPHPVPTFMPCSCCAAVLRMAFLPYLIPVSPNPPCPSPFPIRVHRSLICLPLHLVEIT